MFPRCAVAYADAVNGATIKMTTPAYRGAFVFNLSQLCRAPVELYSDRNTATATNATFYASFCSTMPSPAERLIPRAACSTGGRWLNDFPSFAWQVERPGNDCYRLSHSSGWRATLIGKRHAGGVSNITSSSLASTSSRCLRRHRRPAGGTASGGQRGRPYVVWPGTQHHH